MLRILVKPGDTVAKDQPVLELETDKATIEVPSSVAGKVNDVKVKPGDKVKTGQAILSVEENGAGRRHAAKQAAAGSGRRAEPAAGASTARTITGGRGTRQPARRRQRRRPGRRAEDRRRFRAPSAKRSSTSTAAPRLEPAPRRHRTPQRRRRRLRSAGMARELGVDINQVPGTGTARPHLAGRCEGARQAVDCRRRWPRGGAGERPVRSRNRCPTSRRWGEIEVQPLRAVRRKTAVHLTVAWQTIPHVTQHDSADITNLESIRKNYSKQAEAAGGALTVTAVAVKIVATALKVFPQFNSSIDLANDQMILKKYIHIGVAVDTDRGLLVPVIRNADQKNMLQIAAELHQLSEKARSRKISLDEMQGGCFSVSNLGGIGGTSFTPIVNAPEVAILGISRGKLRAGLRQGDRQFVPALPAAAVAVLRPSRHRRRRRRPVPALGGGSVRAAVPDGAAGLSADPTSRNEPSDPI